MKKGKVLVIAGVAILMLMLVVLPLLAACAKPAPSAPIKIGVIVDFTGVGADYGPQFEEGYLLRFEEANYQAAGRTIELIWEDGGTAPDVALDKARKLVESDGVQIVLGPAYTGPQVGVAPYFKEHNILSLAQFGLDYEELVEYGTWIAPQSTTYAQVMALGEHMADLGYKNIATITMDYSAGYKYMGGIEDKFKEKGGTIVQQQFVPLGTADFSAYITNVSDEADAVVTVVWGLAGFIQQWDSFGMTLPRFHAYMALDIWQDNLPSVGPITPGGVGMDMYTWTIDTPENKRFVDAFEKRFGNKPEELNATGYSQASIVLAALEATGGDESFDKMWDAIINLKLDLPQGPVSFTPNGVGIITTYATAIEKVEGKWAIVVKEQYDGITDPR